MKNHEKPDLSDPTRQSAMTTRVLEAREALRAYARRAPARTKKITAAHIRGNGGLVDTGELTARLDRDQRYAGMNSRQREARKLAEALGHPAY